MNSTIDDVIFKDNLKKQFFVNAMMDVCATICVKRPTLVIELLPTISKVAISIVWDSVGASRVVELYCEYCDICECAKFILVALLSSVYFISVQPGNRCFWLIKKLAKTPQYTLRHQKRMK